VLVSFHLCFNITCRENWSREIHKVIFWNIFFFVLTSAMSWLSGRLSINSSHSFSCFVTRSGGNEIMHSILIVQNLSWLGQSSLPFCSTFESTGVFHFANWEQFFIAMIWTSTIWGTWWWNILSHLREDMLPKSALHARGHLCWPFHWTMQFILCALR